MKSTALLKPAFIVACTLGLLVAPARAYLAPDSFFDVFLEVSQGPPYPPAGPGVLTKLGLPTLPFTQIGQVAMQVKNLTPPGATVLVGSDSGGGVGDPGVSSFFDVFMDVPMMPDSFFDIFTELSSAVGLPMPLAGEPTVVWHADSFFDVFLECDVPGQGRQFLQMSFRVPEGQTTRFNPDPTPQYIAPDSFFDIFMSVSSTAGGQINPALPVFRVIMTGTLGWPQPQPTPRNVVKFRQNPDPTIHGLDVLDSWLTNTSPATLLADDFICTRTGPITDIHLFGSWLNDRVDYWPTFWVGIWDDVPRSGNTPSHPGNLLWWQQFSPGQYRASVYQQGLTENFLDPNAPPHLLGQDHQIWKYDFFPRNPYRQLGSPQLPRVYWLSVVTKTAPGRAFGWKTTRDHYNDYAVYSPTMLTFSGNYPTPMQPWQVIVDHQGRKRELAFMLTTSQTWACNKDFWIPYAYPYGNLRVIVPGPWGIGNNFNGFGGSSGQFSNFECNWDAAGRTIMDWTGGTFTPGQWVHIGFEGPGIFPPFQNWGWWNPFAMSWAGWVPQVSIGWQPLLQPLPRIGLTNILPIVPGLTNNVFISGLTVEYHTSAVPLDQLTRYGARSPIRVDAAPIPTPMISPQQFIQMDMPPPPPEATHAVIIPQINPVNEAGEPNLQMPNVDWAMVPLTETELPTLPPQPELQAPTLAGSEVTLTWTAVPGAVYRVQSKASLSGAGWEDAEGDVIANELTASKAVPVAGDTRFYRVEAVLP
ncbi:MAG TPA: hypothetical protein P5205_04705 [Candidatus Paceibacterota bacterium]|nr:hypothetical protein [Verrucomicrobiota bacterium]HSA09652.1 hypothetical protein [Candidatus Paceibacterota bacterium]